MHVFDYFFYYHCDFIILRKRLPVNFKSRIILVVDGIALLAMSTVYVPRITLTSLIILLPSFAMYPVEYRDFIYYNRTIIEVVD